MEPQNEQAAEEARLAAESAQFDADAAYVLDRLNDWDGELNRDAGEESSGEGSSSGPGWSATTAADFCAACQQPIDPGWPTLRVIHRNYALGTETACGCRIHYVDACMYTKITACLCTANPEGIERIVYREHPAPT